MENFRFIKPRKKLHPTKHNELEYIKKNDAVCVALFDSKLENVIMVKQYRPGNDGYTLEVSAGMIEANEDPILAGYRELEEETGYTKDMITPFIEMPKALYTAPAMATEKIYFYGCKIKNDDIKPNNLKLDETEDIEVIKMNINDLFEKVIDMKSIISIMYFKNVLK